MTCSAGTTGSRRHRKKRTLAETPRPLYRSSGKPGYSGWMELQPGRIWARKFERAVQVRFADSDCSVRTREGVVSAHRGDAILTGVLGEQWRVSRARFADKYRPDGSLRDGEPGAYWCRRYRVQALRVDGPFMVLLADGVSRLEGQPGDWLVDYGDGSLGIVAPEVFTTTYEPEG
ncbi:MAG: hypothetical protein RL684_281 [Pseudomonadota bacterium]